MSEAIPDHLKAVDDAIAAYYLGPEGEWGIREERPTGGNLHIVLDDGNWEARHVAYCREYAAADGDDEGVALADMLLALSDEDRRIVLRVDPNPGESI